MRYKLGITVHDNWRTDNQMVTLIRPIKIKICDINFPDRNYCLGKYNLLENDGNVEDDKKTLSLPFLE